VPVFAAVPVLLAATSDGSKSEALESFGGALSVAPSFVNLRSESTKVTDVRPWLLPAAGPLLDGEEALRGGEEGIGRLGCSIMQAAAEDESRASKR
jgi:hypothetical protein